MEWSDKNRVKYLTKEDSGTYSNTMRYLQN